MSKWNPDHWRKYSREENEQLRDHLQRNGEGRQDYQQWIQELNIVLESPDQSKQSRQQSE